MVPVPAPRSALSRLLVGGLLLLAAGCSGPDDGPSVPEPTREVQPASAGRPVTVRLITPLACAAVPLGSVRFEPLVVGDAEAEQVERCQDGPDALTTTYVFTVRVPGSGPVTVVPGDQPAATFDAAQALVTGAVTVRYAQRGAGRYVVDAIEHRDSTTSMETAPPA